MVKKSSFSFWVLLLTQTLSLIGSRMSAFAVGIWVFTQTGNATPLALVAFFETAPAVLLGNVAGLFADRYDRRHVMFFANVGQTIASVLLIVSFNSGHFQLWHLYTVAAVQSVFAVFLGPAFQASITMLIEDKQRDRANAINQMTGPVAGVLAPGIAGALYVVVGVTGLIVIDLVTFLVAGLAAILVTIPRPEQSEASKKLGGSAWREMIGGFRYLWSKRIMFFLMIFSSLLNFCFNACGALFTPYILARTDNSGTTLGTILSVMNLGAIGGALLMSVWGGTRPRMHTIFPTIILAGVGLVAFGLGQTAWLLVLALLLVMFPLPMSNAAATSLFQAKIPPDLQGRVFAAMNQLSMLLSPLGLLLVGPLADQVFEPAVRSEGWRLVAPLVGSEKGAGMGLMIFGCGVVIAVVSIVVYALPNVRHMEANLPDYAPVKNEPTPAEEMPELAAV